MLNFEVNAHLEAIVEKCKIEFVPSSPMPPYIANICKIEGAS